MTQAPSVDVVSGTQKIEDSVDTAALDVTVHSVGLVALCVVCAVLCEDKVTGTSAVVLPCAEDVDCAEPAVCSVTDAVVCVVEETVVCAFAAAESETDCTVTVVVLSVRLLCTGGAVLVVTSVPVEVSSVTFG